MDLGSFDFNQVFDLFLLLLIGMGPKIALVPFLEATQGMDAATQKRVADHMVRVALGTAMVLLVLGWFLMRLLHFTSGAANVAGGFVLLLLALQMFANPGKTEEVEHRPARDPLATATYPLAVPYLLNPAGIAVLVIISDDIDSVLVGLVAVAVVCLVALIDFAVFRNMDKLANYLNPSRLAVTEAVFGVLLAALAVELMVSGLAAMGVIGAIP